MFSKSKSQTQKFAARLVKQLLNQPRRPERIQGVYPERSRRATIIALHGDLGAGKTTFAQGFLKALGVKQHVTSPTFLIVRKYEISTPLRKGLPHYHHAYHLDLYRIRQPKELLDLGFRKMIQEPHAIVLIEWPERVKKLLPPNTIWIVIEHGKKENERIIEIL